MSFQPRLTLDEEVNKKTLESLAQRVELADHSPDDCRECRRNVLAVLVARRMLACKDFGEGSLLRYANTLISLLEEKETGDADY